MAKRRNMDMQCDPQWVLDLFAELDTLLAELFSLHAEQQDTVNIPSELAERLARPNPDLAGWVTFNTADMILAAKELRELMNKEGV